jgi:glutamyl-tRNA reductase
MNRLLQSAILVGRRVRNETALGAGAVSVASAAAELAGKIFEDLSARSVLLVGVGEMGTLTARHMVERGVKKLTIANRTFSKAEALARELGERRCLSTDSSPPSPPSTSPSARPAPRPIVTRGLMQSIVGKRAGKPIFIIDIAVPGTSRRKSGPGWSLPSRHRRHEPPRRSQPGQTARRDPESGDHRRA